MKTEFIDVSPTQKQIVFEIPAETVETEVARLTRDYGKAARIPGFRPGKAPSRVVRQRYKSQILHDLVHELVPRTLDEVLRERAIEPVDTPDIREVSVDEGQPLKFTAAFETVPPIDAVDYVAITLRRPPVAVGDEAVASTLERLRDRNARLEPIEGRPSRHGDFLAADLERRPLAAASAKGGAAAPAGEPEKHEGVTIEVGSPSNPPGFDAEVTGLEVGSTHTFTVTFPADHPVTELAGTQVAYTVAVKAIKEKHLPELGDEFAKELGDFDSLDTLRARVREDLQRDAERSQQREVREDLLKQLASRVSFDVPDALVAKEVDRRTEEFVRRLLDQGIDPLRAGVDWEDFRGRQQEASRETVKSLLVLDDVARRESLTVSEPEVEAELARLSDRTGRSVTAVRARLEKDGGLGRLYAGLRREKTVEFLLSHVTIVNV